MSYTYPTTPDKAATYILAEMDSLLGYSTSGNILTLKAFARGILKALSEDETGFNMPPGDAGSVSGGLTGSFIAGAGFLDAGTAGVSAASGTISFNQTFTSVDSVFCQGFNTEKIVLVSASTSSLAWKTSDGSTFTGAISWMAKGTL